MSGKENAMPAREMLTKTKIFLALICTAVFVLATTPSGHAAEVITVYKQAYCGCCENWAAHLRRSGFKVNVIDVANLAPLNEQFGIPINVESCHTAKLGNYYIVGHVPVPDIQKLLTEKPAVMGLAVPGMPVGSPGMEMPGTAPDKFNSLLFNKHGETRVYVSH